MRKVLIIIVIVLLLIVGYLMIFNGLNVLGMDVLSIKQIKDKNTELDQKLQVVSTLTSTEQPKALSDLNSSAKQLMIAKEEYNDKILYSSTDDILAASQGIEYETEYLWTKIGNHAKKNTINLRFEIRQSNTGIENQYDLYFTVTGSYVSISEFVASLENDSSLNFKIEDFKLVQTANNTEVLQATFVVREINIKVDNLTSSSSTADTTTDTTTQNDTTTNTVTDNTNTVTTNNQ